MTDKYTSKSQQRGYRTLKALFGHEFKGISNQDLAKQLSLPPTKTFKDLKNLEQAGLAEQLPDDKWRVSPSLGRESVKILNELDTVRKRVEETAVRYGLA